MVSGENEGKARPRLKPVLIVVAFMRDLKPPPPSDMNFFAACLGCTEAFYAQGCVYGIGPFATSATTSVKVADAVCPAEFTTTLGV